MGARVCGCVGASAGNPCAPVGGGMPYIDQLACTRVYACPHLLSISLRSQVSGLVYHRVKQFASNSYRIAFCPCVGLRKCLRRLVFSLRVNRARRQIPTRCMSASSVLARRSAWHLDSTTLTSHLLHTYFIPTSARSGVASPQRSAASPTPMTRNTSAGTAPVTSARLRWVRAATTK